MKKYKAFCIPIFSLLTLTIIAVTIQSCGIARVDHIKAPPAIKEFKIDAALWILGLTIVIGASFSLFIYEKVTKLEQHINQLKKSE